MIIFLWIWVVSEGPRAIDGPQLLGWHVASIIVLLTFLATLGILHAVLLHGRPVIPSLDDLQRENSSSEAIANAFMELNHDVGTLISTYTSEDWVGIAVRKKFAIYQGIPPHIPFNCLSLRRLGKK